MSLSNHSAENAIPKDCEFDSLSIDESLVSESSQTIADYLAQMGYHTPGNCSKGKCGKCTITLTENFNRTSKNVSLSRKVLACQTPLQPSTILHVPHCWKRDSVDNSISILDQTPLPKEQKRCCNHHSYAAALDLGTTTLILSLVDTNSRKIVGQVSKRNPQISFGADLISRIHYACSPERLRQLQEILLLEITCLFKSLFQQSGLSLQEIKHLVLAGNSVMEFLFLGLDPSDMGRSPYEPPFYEFSPHRADEFHLPLLPETPVYLFPLLGSYVGGDLTAGLLALEELFPQFLDGSPQLLMDLGTNGEMILAHKGTFLALSTAAGPVFEGAEIHCGMIAQKGAIEKVDYTNTQQPIRTIGDTEAIGICGSGLLDTISELIRLHLISSNGRLASLEVAKENPLANLLIVVDHQRAFCLTDRVRIFQDDIRKTQLAIGAMRAGIVYLSRYGNISPQEITHFYLAGGFGQHIQRASARRVGLIPQSTADCKVSFLGNSALTGAIIAACQPEILEKASAYRSRTKHISLNEEKDFMETFAQAMLFDDSCFSQ